MNARTVAVDGEIVFWSPTAAARHRIQAGLDPLGLGSYVPEERTDYDALEAAAKQYYPGSLFLIQRLANFRENGLEVCRIIRGEAQNLYPTVVTLKVEQGRVRYRGESTFASQIESAWHAQKNLVPGQTVGRVLTNLATVAFSGIGLRSAGGVYWIAQDRVAGFIEAAKVIEDASLATSERTRVERVSTILDEHTAAAVRHALKAEILAESQRLMAEVCSGDFQEKGLQHRIELAAELKSRVAYYETVLQESLADLTEMLSEVQATAGAAVAMAL